MRPDPCVRRTFATARYDITGSTAEEAFETHCEPSIHDLIERLNRCLIPTIPGESFAKFQKGFYADPVDAVLNSAGVQ